MTRPAFVSCAGAEPGVGGRANQPQPLAKTYDGGAENRIATSMITLRGGCHCENLRYVVTWPMLVPPLPVRACGCDYCSRQGAQWFSNPAAHCTLSIDDHSALLRYQFGTRTADFFSCARCGILTAAVSTIAGAAYTVINANTLADISASDLVRSTTDFSSEERAERLARRTRNWMPVTVGHAE